MPRVKHEAKRRSIPIIKTPKETSTPKDTSKEKKLKETTVQKTPKRRRARPGSLALREIRFYQRTTHNLIPKLPFCRLVKELITREVGDNRDFRIQVEALEALQAATEAFMVRFLEDANSCALHGGRVTLMPKDFKLLQRLKHSTEL